MLNRLVIDGRMANHSGIGVYLRNLVPLIASECKTFVLTEGNSELFQRERINCKLINFDAPIYSITEQTTFNQVVPGKCILWSPHYNIPVFLTKASKRVVTIHDVNHLANIDSLSLLQRVYAKLMIELAVKISHVVITVSEFSKGEIIKYTGCNPHKIRVIHNGVRQKAKLKARKDLMVKYDLPPHYILFVGNVKRYKNVWGLLQAYRRLPNEFRDQYKLVVVGKKEGFITGNIAIEQAIANDEILAGNVICTGLVEDEDLDSIYANASLFIFPSFYEGFGLPPLEAMLNGCPVLSSDAASLPEVCGNAAVYFDPSDPRDIAEKISRVLGDQELKALMVQRGLARVKLFTWEKSADAHSEIFKSLSN